MFFGGDPFEHFAHMHGGGGGGGGGGRPRPRGGGAPVDNEGLYKILDLPKEASEEEIRKAFRHRARVGDFRHPDKGGDEEKFKQLQAANEVLSDPEKRKIYDEHGLEGLKEGMGGGGGDADDIFSMFFGGGGGGGGRGRGGPQKGEDMVHPIKVSLEDLYNSKTVKLAITRNKPCKDCDGRGGKPGAEKSCSDCRGMGVRIQLRQIGPGMVQQMQSACPNCRGAGKSIDERDKCRECKGQKVYKDRKVLEVHVEKGMKHGSKVRFAGEADEVPGTAAGDVIIVVQEKEHERFKRKGADLIIEERLNLSEALCGFVRTITHLDGRVLKISSPAGTVIKEDMVKVINGEGMPFQGNPFTKGRLFIHFKIAFPETLPANAVNAIKSALPRPAEPTLTGEEEECNLTNVDLAQFGQSSDGRSHGGATDDDDDEDGRGQQRVQCNQG